MCCSLHWAILSQKQTWALDITISSSMLNLLNIWRRNRTIFKTLEDVLAHALLGFSLNICKTSKWWDTSFHYLSLMRGNICCNVAEIVKKFNHDSLVIQRQFIWETHKSTFIVVHRSTTPINFNFWTSIISTLNTGGTFDIGLQEFNVER